jgi:hypothetical protein
MRWMKRDSGAEGGAKPPGAGDPNRPSPVDDDCDGDDLELHVCSWCGRFLEGDLEDELNGEGPGRDICGNCNRTKNWEAIEMEQ